VLRLAEPDFVHQGTELFTRELSVQGVSVRRVADGIAWPHDKSAEKDEGGDEDERSKHGRLRFQQWSDGAVIAPAGKRPTFLSSAQSDLT
jgi:hypothetical protein